MGKATREAYGETLRELGAELEQVVVLDADLSKSTKTNVFAKAFPARHFNAGISEQNLTGVGAGLAAAGKIPFISTFAVFATGRAYEQVRNSVCYPKLNVKIAATHAGITVGEDGATHQANEDIALMRVLPNMTVIVPADAAETRAAVTWAAKYEGPVYIRLGRSSTEDIFDSRYQFQPGKMEKLRKGKDLTLFACGIMTSRACQAAELLAAKGIKAQVYNVHTIKPLDQDAIAQAAAETGAFVTCEEHSIIGGLGGAIAEAAAQLQPVPIERVGLQDTFGESGNPGELLEKYHLTTEDIVRAAEKVLARKA